MGVWQAVYTKPSHFKVGVSIYALSQGWGDWGMGGNGGRGRSRPASLALPNDPRCPVYLKRLAHRMHPESA